MKIILKVFVLILTSVILYSCSASGSEEKLNKIPVKDIKEHVNKNSNMIQTIEASGSISIDSPEMTSSGSIEVRIKKPDSVFFKIEGPFGIDIVTSLITRNDFIYYNAQENKAIYGPTNETNIGAILKLRVTFDELINSFGGSFSFAESAEDSIDAESENSNYLIKIKGTSNIRKFLIEPLNYTISKYGVYDNNDKNVLEVSYSKYYSEDLINFPNQIIISKPDRHQTVWLNYTNRSINKNELSFKIKIPKSAKIIRWE